MWPFLGLPTQLPLNVAPEKEPNQGASCWPLLPTPQPSFCGIQKRGSSSDSLKHKLSCFPSGGCCESNPFLRESPL